MDPRPSELERPAKDPSCPVHFQPDSLTTYSRGGEQAWKAPGLHPYFSQNRPAFICNL